MAASDPPHRVVLRAPPSLQPADGAAGLMMNALPMLGSAGAIVLVTSTAAGGSGVVRMLAGGLFVLTTLGFVAVQVDRQRSRRRQQRRGTRAAYLRHLAGVRRVVRGAADRQRRDLVRTHPDPSSLASLVAATDQHPELRTRAAGSAGTARLPAPEPEDERELWVRWGLAPRPLALELVAPEPAEGEVDAVAADALHRLLLVHRVQPDLPALLDLRDTAVLAVHGQVAQTRAVARAVVLSAAWTAPAARLRIAVLTTADRLETWDWVKWLPQTAGTSADEWTGPRTLVATSPDRLEPLVADADRRGQPPHLLLVEDLENPGDTRGSGEPDRAAGATPGTTRLVLAAAPHEATGPLDPPRPGTVRILLGSADRSDIVEARHAAALSGRADRCPPAAAEAAARSLARDRRTGPGGSSDGRAGPATGAGIGALLDLGDLRRLDPVRCWAARPARERLRVPIGTDPGGATVHLDLKESARGGMGPHGLLVGATGSGKSELLRTLVLGLAARHPPDEINLVLVDYKGGATFAGMARLPHVSALITNLAAEAVLVERMADALAGEVTRRQELLRDGGDHASRDDYEQARRTGNRTDLPALPSLLVVVDEFSELLSAEPEFAELFAMIGRLGRSLGIHLLLASQRLDEGRLRGLESHLSYRIGLRTFSAAESRTVLGVPDAVALPASPGSGYLRPEPTSLVRFTAGYVSGPLTTPATESTGSAPRVVPFSVTTPAPAPPPPSTGPAREEATRAPRARPDEPGGTSAGTALDTVVARLAGHGASAHPVWLPPLDEPVALTEVLGELVPDPDLGLVSPRWRDRPGLQLPLGVVDRPREQRRDPLVVDLATAGGHLVTVGAPRSGTSTMLRTAVTALALTTTPTETRCYLLDLGGGALAPLARLPHVVGLATRSEPEIVRRVLAELRSTLAAREETGPDPGLARLVLVVDGWSGLRAGDGELEDEVIDLATRGPGLGLHLLVAANRWAELRPAVRDLVGHRVELRIGDPLDSEIDRRAARRVPADRPGRGLGPGGHQVLVALPEPPSSAGDQEGLVARVSAAWTGPTGPALRLLPSRVDLADVRRAAAAPRATADGPGPLWLGLDEENLAPVGVQPDADPHLVVLGDGGSGRTALLRTLAAEVVRTRPPAQAQLLLVDYRRTLLAEVPEEHLLAHVSDEEQARESLGDLARYLRARLPGREVGPLSLRRRDWWQGAEVFVLVDDHELLTATGPSPLAPLVALLPRARDVGLHVVLARRVGGAGRAHEPVLQTLRDLGAPGLLLPGSPGEGPLLEGFRAEPGPPGRGRLVARGHRPTMVQVAWAPPAG